MTNSITKPVILAFRIPSEVEDAIAVAAKRKFASRTEYLRQIIVECVRRDGGFTESRTDR